MASQWFYQVMGKQIGPISAADLRNLAQGGTIAGDTLVRKAPDGAWVLAERVQGLFSTSNVKTPQPVIAPAPAKTKPPDLLTARIAAPGAASVTGLPKRRLFVGILTAAAIAGCVLVAVIVRGTRRSASEPMAKAQSTPRSQSGTLEVRGTILKVRPWAEVLYLAAGKGEDPTDSFIRQADAIKSAVKEYERLSQVVEKDANLKDEAAKAAIANVDDAALEKNWKEKGNQYAQDLKRAEDWNKHIEKMNAEYKKIEQQREVYKARTTRAPIRFSYNSGSGWKDAVAGAGVGNDLYVPVDGKPQVLQIMIGNPGVCSFAKNDRGEYCLVPVTSGKTVLSVALCGQRMEIPIDVVVLPCKYGDTADQIIGELGIPDSREASGEVERWSYDHWPKAVLIISSRKTLFTVKTGAAHPEDWDQQ